jgi:hypothetical protein
MIGGPLFSFSTTAEAQAFDPFARSLVADSIQDLAPSENQQFQGSRYLRPGKTGPEPQRNSVTFASPVTSTSAGVQASNAQESGQAVSGDPMESFEFEGIVENNTYINEMEYPSPASSAIPVSIATMILMSGPDCLTLFKHQGSR